MSHSGASVGTMSHRCGKYESEWSKCEKKRKRVHVNCNNHSKSSPLSLSSGLSG